MLRDEIEKQFMACVREDIEPMYRDVAMFLVARSIRQLVDDKPREWGRAEAKKAEQELKTAVAEMKEYEQHFGKGFLVGTVVGAGILSLRLAMERRRK